MSSARALTRAPPFFFPLQGVSMITRLFPPPSHGQASGALDASRAREPRPRCAVIFVSTSPLNLPLRCPPRIVRSSGAHGGTNRERSEPKMNNYRSVVARGSRGGEGKKGERKKKKVIEHEEEAHSMLPNRISGRAASCDTFKRVCPSNATLS